MRNASAASIRGKAGELTVKLVEQNTVVVLSTGITATTGMLTVLAHTAVTGGHMAPE
jgi:hypothetical protein